MIIDSALQHLMDIDGDDIIMLTDLSSRKIIWHNDKLLCIFGHPVIDKTLEELILLGENSLMIAELRYCDFVETECIKRESNCISLEQFNASKYFCIRLLITLTNEDTNILTIIKPLNSTKLTPNKVCFL